MPRSNVLVVGAHPDDELLGCGASIAKHVSEGDRVRTMVLGAGIASRKGLSRRETADQLERLHADCQRANSLLNVEKVILEDFPDNSFDSVPRLSIIQAIEAVLAEFKPEVVYTHSESDLNVDHQLVSESVRTACRPLPGSHIRRLLAFEVPSATEWRFDSARSFRPNVFVDVSRYLDLKLKALAEYKGEMRQFPHPRSDEYIRALARVRGGQSGLPAAEAFQLLRSVEL